MAGADDKQGAELAELARLFILWLADNDLPVLPGLKGASFDSFDFYAGSYRRMVKPQMPPLPPSGIFLSADDVKRLAKYGLGTRYRMLVTNPNDSVGVSPSDGLPIYHNRIVRDPKIPMDRPGALKTVAPILASLSPDPDTLGTYIGRDFCTLTNRVDLVWDDRDTAVRVGFDPKYLSIFDQETVPRLAYQVNVEQIPPPESAVDKVLGGNASKQQVLRASRKFWAYLQTHATYAVRDGDYYEKWEADRPTSPDQREFRPALLSQTYLKENFRANEMKSDDEVVNIAVGRAFFVFRLVRETRPGKPPDLTGAKPLVASIPAGTVWPPKDPEWADARVTAAVFKVSEGGDTRPSHAQPGPLRNGIAPTRFVVDYKAYLRWYYEDAQLKGLQDDEQWFERFRRTFFPTSRIAST